MTYDIIASGYVSLDRIIKIRTPAKVGYTSLIENADNTHVYYGGCPINIAWQLARLGFRSLPIVRVGNDYSESGFRDFLEEGHVCTDAVEVVNDDTTSNTYLLEDSEGQHITAFYPGAQDREYFRPMQDKFFKEARLGVLTVGSALDSIEFFKKCQHWGVGMAFGMKADFDAFPPEVLRDILSYSMMIFTNQAERAEIEKRLDLASLTYFLDKGKTRVIVTTLGGEGSIVHEKIDGTVVSKRIDAAHCRNVVDTTGSGDAYISGFLYGFLKGRNTETCGRLGSVMASFVIEAMGCCTGAPTEAELLSRLKSEA